MTIYVSGPISGRQHLNRPAFEAASKLLESRGHVAMRPAWDEPTYRSALTMDVQNILWHADALYMLKGWEHSPGSRAEHAVAVALKLPIRYEAEGPS